MAAVSTAPTHGQPILLYDSGVSSYTQRAWITLTEKSLNFERKLVDLNDKPEHFKQLYASIHPDPSAPAKVPIIIDGNNQLIESIIVSEYLDNTYRSHKPKLFPEDPLELAKVRWFVELFSQTFQAALFEMLGAKAEGELQAAHSKLDSSLKTLNKFIEQHGSNSGGDYFLGDRYSFAEVAATPFTHRAQVALPVHRGYNLYKSVEQQGLTRLGAWLKAASARPSFQQTVPSDEAIIDRWRRFTGDFNGKVKQ